MIVSETKGNILETKITNIAHGVNCKNAMGSGVAKAIYTCFPDVKKQYHLAMEGMLKYSFSESKYALGKIQKVICGEKNIFNCWTQDRYGYNNEKLANYWAIGVCFKSLSEQDIKEIAIPKIGCGLAGGDWGIVKQIINDATLDDLDVHVYYL